MSDPATDRIEEKLQRRLGGSPPGPVAQLTMAPAHRRELIRDDGSSGAVREAAVLVAIVDRQHPKVVLTQRRPDLKYHPGQISFPGGRREPGESLQETALRETYEEVGLAREQIRIVGRLSPLYVPPSRFRVYPFVGMVDTMPTLHPADDEVSRIILVDLQLLCDPGSRASEKRMIRGREVDIPFFRMDGEKIWGATAMMIAELVAALDD